MGDNHESVRKSDSKAKRKTTSPQRHASFVRSRASATSHRASEPELAIQVPSLRIFERCNCGDDICCGTFYTQPKPKGSFGPGHRNVRLIPDEGMLILDVADGEIACVEVLDRGDVRQKLDEVFP